MWTIDLFLLERLFQALADRLAHRATCFTLAWTLLGIAAAINAALALQEHVDHGLSLPGVGSLCNVALVGQCALACVRTERTQKAGHRNPNVLRYALARHFMLLLALPVLARTLSGGLVFPQHLFPVQGAAWLAGLYFMACRPSPPALPRHAGPASDILMSGS